MRKTGWVLLICAAFLMVSATCFAMDMDRMQAGPKAGLHIPVGDYSDGADMGFTFGGQLKVPYNENVSVGGHLAYAYASDIVDVTIIEIYPFADYYLNRTEKADFFLRGAMGFNWWEWEYSSWGFKSEDDGIDVMLALGGGANFMDNFEAVFLYNQVLTGDFDEGYLTLTIGYNFDL